MIIVFHNQPDRVSYSFETMEDIIWFWESFSNSFSLLHAGSLDCTVSPNLSSRLWGTTAIWLTMLHLSQGEMPQSCEWHSLSASAHTAHISETMGQKLAVNLNIMVWPLLAIKNPLVRAQKVREACETYTGFLSPGWTRISLVIFFFMWTYFKLLWNQWKRSQWH